MHLFCEDPSASLWTALFGEFCPKTVAVVGAGGKTSTVKTLAAERAAAGLRVVITTTTKMHPPEERELLCGSVEAVLALLAEKSPVWAGNYFNEYKIEGLAEPIASLAAVADHVLIEADGAKKLPLKMIDRSHEPVIPPETDAVVAVAGMDAIGKPLGLTVHRPELACAALGVPMEHVVTPEDAARLLRLCYAPRYVILNKADGPRERAAAEAVAACLPEARCVITRLRAFGLAEAR